MYFKAVKDFFNIKQNRMLTARLEQLGIDTSCKRILICPSQQVKGRILPAVNRRLLCIADSDNLQVGIYQGKHERWQPWGCVFYTGCQSLSGRFWVYPDEGISQAALYR